MSVGLDGVGNIYVIDQLTATIAVCTYDGATGLVLERALDLVVPNPIHPVPGNPEGIAFDSATGNLVIISARDLAYVIFEYTTAGAYLGRYGLGDFSPLPAFGTPEHNLTAVDSPHCITFGPASGGSRGERVLLGRWAVSREVRRPRPEDLPDRRCAIPERTEWRAQQPPVS